jgi:hypothetical protein
MKMKKREANYVTFSPLAFSGGGGLLASAFYRLSPIGPALARSLLIFPGSTNAIAARKAKRRKLTDILTTAMTPR